MPPSIRGNGRTGGALKEIIGALVQRGEKDALERLCSLLDNGDANHGG